MSFNIEVPQHPFAINKLEECIAKNSDWIMADMPRQKIIGFFNPDELKFRMFNSDFVMAFPANVKRKLRRWRKKYGVIKI